jgi:hypothetical protein
MKKNLIGIKAAFTGAVVHFPISFELFAFRGKKYRSKKQNNL